MIIITNKQNYIIKNNVVESITCNQIILVVMFWDFTEFYYRFDFPSNVVNRFKTWNLRKFGNLRKISKLVTNTTSCSAFLQGINT